MPWLVGVDDWLAGQRSTEQRQRKIELDPISTEERLRQLFAVYGCNRTEFSYVMFTEQRNFTTAKRRNGNVRTATEWWKPGISRRQTRLRDASCVTSFDRAVNAVALSLRRRGCCTLRRR